MALQPGNHVDNSGKCYLTYLSNWNQHPTEEHSTVLRLVQELSRVFAIQCPVYSKPVSKSASSTPQLVKPQPQHPYHQSPPSSTSQLLPQHSSPQYRPQQSHSQLQSPAPQVHQQLPIPSLPPKLAPGHSNLTSPPPLPPLPQDLRQRHITSPSLNQINVRPQHQAASFSQQKINMHTEPPNFMDDLGSAKEEDTQRKAVLDNIHALVQKLYEVEVAHDVNTFSNGIEQIHYAIEKFEKIFDYEFGNVAIVKSQISENEQILKSTIQKAESTIAEANAHAELDPEATIIAETIVHNQLYELVSEDLAIADTISVLTKAYEVGKIPLQSFIKNTRSLSREQFLKRALINKISNLLKLE